jgi:hypothetical protein
MNTFGEPSSASNRPAAYLSGLQKRFELPVFDGAAQSDWQGEDKKKAGQQVRPLNSSAPENERSTHKDNKPCTFSCQSPFMVTGLRFMPSRHPYQIIHPSHFAAGILLCFKPFALSCSDHALKKPQPNPAAAIGLCLRSLRQQGSRSSDRPPLG